MIYLDNAATTKPSENAVKKAYNFISESFYNPSALYRQGITCAEEIKKAKDFLLTTLKTSVHEVIFTSGGSESDNQAIFCAKKRGVFVTDNGEHSAVYKSFSELKNRGYKVIFCDLNKDGSVNVQTLLETIKNEKDVSFVSIVHVNNETGAINDINYIAKKIKEINPAIIFHSDGVQAYGKLNYRLSSDVDLYSVSAHKINGIKGVGALFKKKGLNLSPLIFGGGQENGLRSGTENVFGIKVFEYAAEEHVEKLTENFKKVKNLNDYVRGNIDKDIFTVISGVNGSPYILTVSASGVRGETVMHLLEDKDVIIGNGSACSSKSRFSRIVGACGYDEKTLDGLIRISFSADNTLDEIVEFITILNETVKELKGILHK